MKRFARAAGVIIMVAACVTWIRSAGAAGAPPDHAATSATREAGGAAAPVAGNDNAARQEAGADNAASSARVYDVATDTDRIRAEWGIRFETLRLTAAGAMLDFRYRILDPARALPIVDRRNKPYMVAQATGEKLEVPSYPKVGPLRQTTAYGKPKLGKIYYILFSNHGKRVKSGDKVSVVIGDFRLENVVVQ